MGRPRLASDYETKSTPSLGAGGLDGILDAGNFVGRKVVYHDDVATLERRHQALLDIGHERCSVDWPVEDRPRMLAVSLTQRTEQLRFEPV